MKAHLAELTVLLGRPIAEIELESLEKTASLVDEVKKRFQTPNALTFEIPFGDRLLDLFKHFVMKLHASNPSPIYIWVERTNYCGVLRVPSVCSIKYDFDFWIERNGVISLVTEDLKDKFVLDLLLSDDGEERLELRVQGENWGGIKYD